MSTWTCGKCGFTAKVVLGVGPVHCVCGFVDVRPHFYELNDLQEVKSSTVHAVPKAVQRIYNYTTALQRWMKLGCPVTTDEDLRSRFAICKRCEMFNGEICTHLNCGCNIRVDDSDGKLVKLAGLLGIEALTERAKAMTNKLRMATESCPIGKWGPIETTSQPERPP